MNVAGFSPTDTIVSYSGLVWMGQLLHAVPGAMASTSCCWWAACSGASLQALRGRARLRDVAIYAVLGVAPAPALRGQRGLAPVPPVVRRAVRGPRSPPEAAAQIPAGTARVPRGFVLLVSAIQDTVQELLPRINGDFVRNPFALFAATNSLMTEALQHDPALRARTADFLDRCYAPAVTRWLQARPNATKEDFARVDTPLSDELTPLYAQIPVADPTGGGGLAGCGPAGTSGVRCGPPCSTTRPATAAPGTCGRSARR